MNIRDLLSEKTELQTRAKALWDKKEKSNRAFSETELAEYKGLQREIEAKENTIKRESEKLTLKHNALTDKKDDFSKAVRGFSLHKFLKHKVYAQRGDSNFKVDAGSEIEVTQELRQDKNPAYLQGDADFIPERALLGEAKHKRTFITSADATGGELISELVRPQDYIELLYDGTWMSEAGVTVLSGLQGNIKLPKGEAKASIGWTDGGGGSSSDFSEQDMSFNSVSLSPLFAGFWQGISLSILTQSQSDSIETFIRREMLASFRSGLDTAFIQGDGSSNGPTGLIEISDISTQNPEATNTNGSKPVYKDFLTLEKLLLTENQMAEPTMLCNSDLKIMTKNMLRFTTPGSLTVWNNNQLADHRTIVTNGVPNDKTKGTGTELSVCILFIPSSVVVGRWQGLQISVNTLGDSFWKKGAAGIRLIDVCNMTVKRPKDIAVMENMITTL